MIEENLNNNNLLINDLDGCSLKDLFNYGKELISKKEYDKATTCFEKCYKIDSNNIDTCNYLFLLAIQDENYKKAFIYFEELMNINNKFYDSDNNFYLYLLNIITEIPEKYKQYVKFFKYKDIKIDFNDERYNEIEKRNKIRLSCFNKKFKLALFQFNELKSKEELNVSDVIIYTLLTQSIGIISTIQKNIGTLLYNKSYSEITQYLEEMQEKGCLGINEEYILTLSSDILKIKNTNNIPKVEIFETDDMYDAIDGKNYDLALELNIKYFESKNLNPNSNYLNILLTNIIELIEQKKEETINRRQGNNTLKVTFLDLTTYLLNEDLDNFSINLKKYLKSINKSKYEFLIVDLIKISLIEQDFSFLKPMAYLSYISREKFKFDISEYIKSFYETLSKKRFDLARIYLDIISNSNKVGQACILTKDLQMILQKEESKEIVEDSKIICKKY
ncbi:MAG: hypothetical protein NC181_01475 [Clostridium sp.]|nr:hypothetical protein [Clostridium sp.]MCM1444491.1 hypothetical protein [Candidatus Amulumruptor caecigallinarius]